MIKNHSRFIGASILCFGVLATGIGYAYAATLPPLSHFKSGSILQATDMQAIVQSVADLQSSGGSGGDVIHNNSVNITASGGEKPTNSALYLGGNLKGASSASVLPFTAINVADTVTSVGSGSTGVTGLVVNHAVMPGAGTGSRAGILGILSHNTATQGSGTDDNYWYTGIFSQMIANHDDGGTPGSPRGNFFGMGSITSICGTCKNVSSLVGAEYDVVAAPGSSVNEKIGIQIVQINNDSVRGSVYDAAIGIVNDRLGYTPAFNTGAHPGWMYGIAFGKPGNDWPIAPQGTIIGATQYLQNAVTAAHGIDFSGVTFSVDAFKSPGFVVSKTGAVTANDPITTSGTNAGLFFNDRTTGGTSAWYRMNDVVRLWDAINGDLVTVTNAGRVRFATYGAGTLQTDASGNVSVSSDERLKTIDGVFTRGLADIEKISPISYHWNVRSGLDQSTQYSGFSAQNVQTAIPEAVGVGSNGYLTLQDRPLLAALVNAVKEIAQRVNGMTEKFTTKELCIGSTCVTEDQLKALLANASTTTNIR